LAERTQNGNSEKQRPTKARSPLGMIGDGFFIQLKLAVSTAGKDSPVGNKQPPLLTLCGKVFKNSVQGYI
jgi:hypothetical protein